MTSPNRQPNLGMPSPVIRIDDESAAQPRTPTSANFGGTNGHRNHRRVPYLRPDSFIEESETDLSDDDNNLIDTDINMNIDFSKPKMSFLDSELTMSPFKSPTHSPTHSTTPFDSPSIQVNKQRYNNRYSMYNLQNSSGSSFHQPSKHTRANSSTSQYIPGPMLPPRGRSPIRPKSPVRNSLSRGTSPIRASSPSKFQPFKFGSIMMNNSSDNLSIPGSGNGSLNGINGGSSTPQKASYRRGHRYKHSSVSMNMFQEPAKLTPKNIPKTYDVPSREQIIESLSKPQKLKLSWSFFHVGLSLVTYILGFHFGNICLSTLSHLILYDSIGNLLIVTVQVMTNFDIWKNSSLKYPFGLGRIEVLVGFGLSVSLLFVGIELLSHLLEEHVVDLVVGGGHASEEVHSHHVHENKDHQMNPILYELFLALIITVTLASSRVLLGGTTVSKSPIPDAPRKPYARRLSSLTLEEPKKTTTVSGTIKKYNLLSNSTSILTLTYAIFSMLYPLSHGTEYVELVNQLSTFVLALLVLYIGSRLIKKLSNVLLLGTPFKGLKSQIIKNISTLDVFKSSYKIQDLLITKVNHKIFIIILKVKMVGASEEDESKLRFYASKIIRNMMFKALNGELDNTNSSSTVTSNTTDVDADRKSLIDILNFDSPFDYLDNTGEQFEITIDVDRL